MGLINDNNNSTNNAIGFYLLNTLYVTVNASHFYIRYSHQFSQSHMETFYFHFIGDKCEFAKIFINMLMISS